MHRRIRSPLNWGVDTGDITGARCQTAAMMNPEEALHDEAEIEVVEVEGDDILGEAAGGRGISMFTEKR